ncbi:MAG: hypothetical protein ACREDR_22965, partial [Blastocatellia bacterium]
DVIGPQPGVAFERLDNPTPPAASGHMASKDEPYSVPPYDDHRYISSFADFNPIRSKFRKAIYLTAPGSF